MTEIAQNTSFDLNEVVMLFTPQSVKKTILLHIHAIENELQEFRNFYFNVGQNNRDTNLLLQNAKRIYCNPFLHAYNKQI